MDDGKKPGMAPSPAARAGQKTQRVVTIPLSRFVFGMLVTGVLICWSFIFGIMLGRGYAPEDTFPAVAGLMPQETPASAAFPEDGLLPPEELDYHASLREDDSPAPSLTPPTPSSTPARTVPQTTPPRQAAPATTTVPRPSAAASAGERSDYVYQVAAYKETGSADRLLSRLQRAGLNAEVESRKEADGTTWYRALVRFRGRPDDIQTLRDTLAPMGISQIMLRSRTPVQ